jgi:hypothetical protein
VNTAFDIGVLAEELVDGTPPTLEMQTLQVPHGYRTLGQFDLLECSLEIEQEDLGTPALVVALAGMKGIDDLEGNPGSALWGIIFDPQVLFDQIDGFLEFTSCDLWSP